jgi:uncharacterized protein (TIGR02145 family)
MKRILLTLLSWLLVLFLSAQAPQSFKYQTVVRDAAGVLKVNQSVSFRISILEGASPAYVEKFVAKTTNDYGLVTLDIGKGALVSGSFTGVDWQNDGPFFLKTEIDMAGGETFTEVGTSELLSVPFALHSETVNKIMDATPVTGDMVYFNGTSWVAVPAGLPGQFLQLQTTNTPKWSGPAFPTLTTKIVTNIMATTATGGGEITNDGGGALQERGVCWSTSENPTIADSKTSDGSGIGSFVSNLTGLLPGTTYYVRAYATNWSTGYGNQVSFTTSEGVGDYDGNTYDEVTIGTQVWMKENLKTTHFRDGTPITLVENDEWGSKTTEAYCWYDNEISNKDLYGALYNTYAVTNTHNLCPAGWHVPTEADWTTLFSFLGGVDIAGGKMKEAGLAHWNTPNTDATNESGFTALPGGHRQVAGAFVTKGDYGYWSYPTGCYKVILNNSGGVLADCVDYRFGFSVRCIKDSGKK